MVGGEVILCVFNSEQEGHFLASPEDAPDRCQSSLPCTSSPGIGQSMSLKQCASRAFEGGSIGRHVSTVGSDLSEWWAFKLLSLDRRGCGCKDRALSTSWKCEMM